MANELLSQLEGVSKIDYVISHHAEQDHSGAIPRVLERYPDAKLILTSKAKGMLIDLLRVPEKSFMTVEDGQEISLGDKTLKFLHTPSPFSRQSLSPSIISSMTNLSTQDLVPSEQHF